MLDSVMGSPVLSFRQGAHGAGGGMDGEWFRAKARQCRALAERASDQSIVEALEKLAREFEDEAAALDSGQTAPERDGNRC
jgi:hypothetical protein